MLSGCDGLVLEFNHDAELLACSAYPASVKRRIAGRFGHLENGAAAALLREIDCSHLQHLVAAHLSERNNQPERVLSIAANVLAGSGVEIAVATPDFGFDWRSLV
jgi:phosphoribosyl 1,2-cyclic phosphodiesterase